MSNNNSGYSAPSLKRLVAELNVTPETAKKIRGLIRGDYYPEEIPAVEKWVKACYNFPRWTEQVLEGLNALLEGHGVESLRGKDVDAYWEDTQLLYVNTGGSYTATLAYDTVRDRFLITSWGDFYERNRRRFPER